MQDNPWRAPIKQPGERKDYEFNWDPFLEPGDAILSQTLTVSPVGAGALEIDASSRDSTNRRVKIWTTLGVDGVDYHVTCQVTCLNGGVYERDMVIPVEDQ